MTLLHIWLLMVTTVGIGVNSILARCLLKKLVLSARSIITGIAATLGTQAAIVAAVFFIAKRTCHASKDQLEQIGYFAGPIVLAFVAMPVGILACWYGNRRSE